MKAKRKAKPPKQEDPLKTKEGNALQKRLRQHILNQYSFSNKMGARSAADFGRRAARVYAFQEKLLASGLEAAGISGDELRARQEKDHELARRHHESQRRLIATRSNTLAAKHRRQSRRRQAMRRHLEYKLGNPGLSVFLCERSAKHFHATEASTGHPTMTLNGPGYVSDFGENVTRFQVGVDAGGLEWGRQTVVAMDEFAYIPDVKGIMNVEALVHLNGGYDINLSPKCIGHSAASLRMTPVMYVSQNVIGQEDVTLNSVEFDLLDIDRTAGCVAMVTGGPAMPFDTGEMSLTRSNFPVQANKPVIIAVVLWVVVDAWNDGAVSFDLWSERSFQMDVPCVALFIDY